MGKIIGAIVGWLLLHHPLGIVLGGLLGHMLDIGVIGGGNAPRAGGGGRGFIDPLFSLVGALAKSDGHVSPEEIAATELLMARMRLDEAQRRTAIERFNQGKQVGFPTHLAVADLKAWCAGRRDHAYILIDLLLDVVCAEGPVVPAKFTLLCKLTWALGVHDREVAALAAMKGYAWPGVDPRRSSGPRGRWEQQPGGQSREAPPPGQPAGTPDPYTVLGITRDAQEREIKRAYRKLISEHHPDKLGDVPAELRARAEERAREINAAYERVKAAKGFK